MFFTRSTIQLPSVSLAAGAIIVAPSRSVTAAHSCALVSPAFFGRWRINRFDLATLCRPSLSWESWRYPVSCGGRPWGIPGTCTLVRRVPPCSRRTYQPLVLFPEVTDRKTRENSLTPAPQLLFPYAKFFVWVFFKGTIEI